MPVLPESEHGSARILEDGEAASIGVHGLADDACTETDRTSQTVREVVDRDVGEPGWQRTPPFHVLADRHETAHVLPATLQHHVRAHPVGGHTPRAPREELSVELQRGLGIPRRQLDPAERSTYGLGEFGHAPSVSKPRGTPPADDMHLASQPGGAIARENLARRAHASRVSDPRAQARPVRAATRRARARVQSLRRSARRTSRDPCRSRARSRRASPPGDRASGRPPRLPR